MAPVGLFTKKNVKENVLKHLYIIHRHPKSDEKFLKMFKTRQTFYKWNALAFGFISLTT